MLKAKEYLEERYDHEGYSVGWNTGEMGGQSIPHAHLHVIPRFADEPFAGKGIRYWIKQNDNIRGTVVHKFVTVLAIVMRYDERTNTRIRSGLYMKKRSMFIMLHYSCPVRVWRKSTAKEKNMTLGHR